MLNICSEAARCLLCDRAGCTAACPKGFDPAGMLRSVRFENAAGAAWKVDAAGCAACEGPCEKACLHDDFPLRIRQVAAALPGRHAGPEYSNLAIDFLGVHCENPFFLSSSVVASSYEMCARALSMGWAGVVYKTIGLFIPQEVSPRFDAIGKEGTPFVGFRNLEQISDHDPDENFEILRRLKAAFPEKVIVSSIMGRSEAEWTELARRSEQAGADIIALDCTEQINAEGRPAYELLPVVKKEFPDVMTFADVSTFEEAARAVEMGADIVGPTLYGYTEKTKQIEEPNLREFARMCREFGDKAYMIMEGHIYSPEDAIKCLYLGAHAVVVGSAITRPHYIARRFTDLMNGYRQNWRDAERSAH